MPVALPVLLPVPKNYPANKYDSAFYKIYISGAANRHAPVQYAKYVVVFFSWGEFCTL